MAKPRPNLCPNRNAPKGNRQDTEETYPRDRGQRDASGPALERGVGALLRLDHRQHPAPPPAAVDEPHLLGRRRRRRRRHGVDVRRNL